MSNEGNKKHDENKGGYDLLEGRNKKIVSALKAVGIVLLVAIGIPLLLFGTCILLASGYNGFR